jgi:outer membrane murein-binding lipoprotein Lpp
MTKVSLTALVLSVLWLSQGCQSNAAKDKTVSTDSTTTAAVAPTDSVATAEPATTPAPPDSVAAGKPLTSLDSLALIGPKITGAIMPQKRILAYYGNPHSKKMGILGEYPKDEMLRRLDQQAVAWVEQDSAKTPVQKALHLVAISAQGAPGKDGKYRMRMSDKTITKVIRWAAEHNAICFLDIQVGLAPLGPEMEFLEPYLKLPYVHLGIDPEFSMKTGARPGTKIGTFDAADINQAVQFVSRVVRENKLPPKVLVVHRFTNRMVTNYKNIKLDPNVQIVMNMDGWGPPSLKRDTYHDYIQTQPVQFTGFKLFYHNDMKKVDLRSKHKVPHLMEPAEVLSLTPKPMYIQYQ